MSRTTIVIGSKCYPSKTAAAQAIRTILYRYPPRTTVDPDDAAFLGDVLAGHPEFEDKAGCGVKSFQVEQNFGSRGFWLTRVDGTRTDWSFLSCLTPPTHEREVKAAMRTDIRDQIASFRIEALSRGPVNCPITCDTLSFGHSHVDHVPPFEVLVRAFLEAAGITLESIAVRRTVDGETDTVLEDRNLAALWRLFHQQHAGLRLVSPRANLSLLRRANSACLG